MASRGRSRSDAAIISPTPLDLAWASGIFEGEGSAVADKTQRVTVPQKDRWLCDRFKRFFGGSVVARRNLHEWRAYGARARGFLMTIYKFLSPRRKAQVRRALGLEVT